MKYSYDKDIIKLFGIKVKEYRISQNITQAQLAFEAEMPREQIGRIERGQINTSLKKIEAIAKALNIHPKDLLDF